MDLFGEDPSVSDEDIDEKIFSNEVSSEGLRHPRAMDFCLGHDAVEKKLLEFINGQRPPHGLIFTGPKGIGKATMAYRFSRYLLKNGTADPAQDSLFGAPSVSENLFVSPDDPIFRRVASGGHADMMSVERAYDAAKNRYKAGVEVDEVRKVAPFLRMTAADGGWRVVIIDDADTMNRNSQNALLKILEEPPKNAVLILIAHRLGALIPTILSRARVVSFQSLSENVLREILQKHPLTASGEALDTLVHLAQGSVGKAIEYQEEGALETFDKIIGSFELYPRWNWVTLHALADDLSRAGREQSYQAFSELLQLIFSQIARCKARGQALQFKPLEPLLRNSSLEQLLKICENLQSHFSRVEAANLDKRQGVLGAFSLISA